MRYQKEPVKIFDIGMTGKQEEIKNKDYLRNLEEAWKKEMLYNQRSAETSAETQRSDISWETEKNC